MCGRSRSFSRPLYLDILIHINVGAAPKKAYAMLSTNLSVVLSPPGHEIRMRLAQAHMAQRFPFLIGKRFGQMWSWNAGMTPFEGTLKTFWTGRESFALSSPPFSHSRLYLQHFFFALSHSGIVEAVLCTNLSKLNAHHSLTTCGCGCAVVCLKIPVETRLPLFIRYHSAVTSSEHPAEDKIKAKPVP